MKNVLTLMVTVMFALVAFGYGMAISQEKPIVLKLAHINVAGGMIDKQAQKFAELVAARTKGRVKIDVYPASQLGNMTEQIEGVSMGSINIVLESETMLYVFQMDLQVYGVPFLMTREIASTNPYLKELREKVRTSNNIRILPGQGWRPDFHLWTKKRIVKVPEDLQGMKIRKVQQKIQIDVWNGLGATAVPIPWGEVYMALAQGVVDGIDHNIVQIYEEKFYEQLKYCTLLDCLLVGQSVLVNEKLFSGLPADVQKAMNEASLEAANFFTDLAASLEGDAKKNMEKAGIQFVQGDRKVWVKQAAGIMQKLENEGVWSKGLLKKLGME
jgi:C4-dicarboxylate-binding protein DctP